MVSSSVSKVKEKIRNLERRFTEAPGSPSGRRTLGPPEETTFEASRSGSECSSSSASNLPEGCVRSRRRSNPAIPSSFDIVRNAVDEHLKDLDINSNASNPIRLAGGGILLIDGQVASNSFQHSNISRNSHPSTPLHRNGLGVAPSPSTTSHSNQTLVTSHVVNSAAMVSPNVPRKPANRQPPRTPGAVRPIRSSAVRAISFEQTGPSSSKRKPSVPVKREVVSVKDRRVSSAIAQSPSKKRSRQQVSVDENLAQTTTDSHSELSRGERSNPPSSASKRFKAPNTRPIYEFFNQTTNKAVETPPNPSRAPLNATNSHSGNYKKDEKQHSPQLPAPTETALPDNAAWKEKYLHIKTELQAKIEQLNDVKSSRDLRNMRLGEELEKAYAESARVKAEVANQVSKMGSAMEEIVRWKSKQQAQELRAKLAMESPRLGRFGYARVITHIKETWEEGYAAKELLARKEKLKQERKSLLQRRERLLAHQEASNKVDGASISSGHTSDDESRIPGMTRLEFAEEAEAIEVNLENLKREEERLQIESETLKDEQAAHIRALRRVANEDASVFQTRPKLNGRYVLDCILGKGGFSEVWQAYDLVELREVAVKIHQLDPRWAQSKIENYTKHVAREYEIHRSARHPRVVSLFDVFEIDKYSFATVLECCSGTDLDIVLKERKMLPERHARKILLQIMSGMQYLSRNAADGKGVIHYDLKPGNILFDEHGDAKITDFGLSKIVESAGSAESMELTSKGAGTYWYLPPECFIMGDEVRISSKVDVWSIGVIFYQMLYGRRPFGEGRSQEELMTNSIILNAREVAFPDHPDVSLEAKEFIRSCLKYDQAYRPNMTQLCNESYLLVSPFPHTTNP